MDYRANQLTVGNVLSKTFDFFKKNILALFVIAVISGFLSLFFSTDTPTTNGLQFLLTLIFSLVVIPAFTAIYQVELYDAYKENRSVSIGSMLSNIDTNAIRINIKKTFKIALWYLLLVIPGIYFTLAYDRVVYIRHQYPELSDKECFNKSKKEMMDYKFTLFVILLIVSAATLIIVGPIIYAIISSNEAREIIRTLEGQAGAYTVNTLSRLSNFDYIRVMFKVSALATILVFFITSIFGAYNAAISPVFHNLRDEEKLASREL